MGDLIELYPALSEARSGPLIKTVLLRTDTGDADCNVAFASLVITRSVATTLVWRLAQFEQATAVDRYLVEMVYFDLLPRLIRYSSQTTEFLDMVNDPGPGFVVIDECLDLRAATLAPARWSRMRVSSRGIAWTIRPRKHNVLVKTGVIPPSVVRDAVEALRAD